MSCKILQPSPRGKWGNEPQRLKLADSSRSQGQVKGIESRSKRGHLATSLTEIISHTTAFSPLDSGSGSVVT